MKLSDLTPNDRNPRTIKTEAFARLCASIQRDPEFMVLRPIVHQGGRILGGNMRWRACQELGMTEIPDAWAVEASTLTPEQARRFVLVDNAPEGMAGEWDYGMLADDWELPELEALGFDLSEFDAPEGEAKDAEPKTDRAEELRKEWGVETGQLWALGEHSLLCGDSTKAEDVVRVMGGEKADFIFTDPPYGHNNNDGDLIQRREAALGRPEKASSKARPIDNDSPEEAARVYGAFLHHAAELLKPGCCCCCCCGGGGPDPQFARWSLEMDKAIGFKMAVVWDKGGLGMGWHYRRCYELVLVAAKPGAAVKWYGGNDVPNVIRDIGKIIPSADQHPTEKPVELPAFFIGLHSQPGDVVWEPFAGSGTTIIACEQLGRRCCAIEIAPGYVAVALQRWADATGRKPELVAYRALLDVERKAGELLTAVTDTSR